MMVFYSEVDNGEVKPFPEKVNINKFIQKLLANRTPVSAEDGNEDFISNYDGIPVFAVILYKGAENTAKFKTWDAKTLGINPETGKSEWKHGILPEFLTEAYTELHR